MHLRHIASTIAREVEFFWANIEQVLFFEPILKSVGLFSNCLFTKSGYFE